MKLSTGLTKLFVACMLTLMPTGGILMIAGCRSDNATILAATETHITFSSPEEAGKALEGAALSGDQETLTRILGENCVTSLNSGNLEEDKAALASFASKYDRMNRWVSMTDGSKVLYIGADNYQFPVPLVQTEPSKWRFDSDAGEDEVLARRIGENELRAVDIALAIASEEGLPAEDIERILSGYSFRAIAANSRQTNGARAEGTTKNQPVILASPVEYGGSGIMTFLISKEGAVYEKDLGRNTREIARAIAVFEPGDGWKETQ
jgi:hypothetical protein